MSTVKFREMSYEDLSDVANINVLAWKYAYKDILSPHFLENISLKEKVRNWQNGFEKYSDLIRLVMILDDKVIGYAIGAQNRHLDLVPNSESELYAIYLNPHFIDRGHGRELFKHFSKVIKDNSFKSMCVWVLEQNMKARGFYEKMGGILTPISKEIEIDKNKLNEVCYEFHGLNL